MSEKLVKDIMIPIDEYAVVPMTATILEALNELKRSQKKLTPGRFLHRAVLVRNDKGGIVGKIGHLAFLKALEPKYDKLGKIKNLSRAGLTPDFLSSMATDLNLWQGDLKERCKMVRTVKVTQIMHPVTEQIDLNASLSSAIHRIVLWQTLSILVTDEDRVVGILRLSDLFEAVFEVIIADCQQEKA